MAMEVAISIVGEEKERVNRVIGRQKVWAEVTNARVEFSPSACGSG